MVELPQLRMAFTRFDAPTAPALPPGYGLRTFRPGDEEAWIAILASGDFGEWDRPRLERMLAGERAPLPLAGVFFATRDDRPAATACTFLYQDARGAYSELGWVGALPEHRGRGLGAAVSRAVLGYARSLGHGYVFLKTEDFRLAAIKTYLRLGFEPEMVDASHPARWAVLRATLALY